MIVGDFTFYPLKDLYELFKSLFELKFQFLQCLVIVIVKRSEPPIQKELKEVLESLNITFLHNSSSTIKNTNIKILGLGTLLVNEDDISKISNFQD